MKNLLLNFYEMYEIKDYLFKNWIIKDSLVLLIDRNRKITSLFYVDKNNMDHLEYYKVAKLDLYSLTFGSNYSVIKKSDSNNEFSFMFKKEKKLEDNIHLIKSYQENLTRKLGVTQDPIIEIALNHLLKMKEFLELKEGTWIKIFLDTDIEKYIESHKRYVEFHGDMDIFINTANPGKKPYLSKNSSIPTRNIQKVKDDDLKSLFFIDKFFYLMVRLNKTHIYFDNIDSTNIQFCNYKETEEKATFNGYYIEVDQDNGRGKLLNFLSINKREYKNIDIQPLYFLETLNTLKNKNLKVHKFNSLIFGVFKIQWDEKNRRSNCINFENIRYHLDKFLLLGTPIPFKYLKNDFLKIIELTFFNSYEGNGRDSTINYRVMDQLNIFNTIYKEEKMESLSYTLGKIVKYLETKTANGFGDYRNHFRDMTFKIAKNNLERLVSYHGYNVYSCINYKELKEDFSKILNANNTDRVDNIELLKGYLDEITYYKKGSADDDLCS